MRSALFPLSAFQESLLESGVAPSTLAAYTFNVRRLIRAAVADVDFLSGPPSEEATWIHLQDGPRILRAMQTIPVTQRGAAATAWRAYVAWVKASRNVDLADPVPLRRPGRPVKTTTVGEPLRVPFPVEVAEAVRELSRSTQRGIKPLLSFTWGSVSGRDRESPHCRISDPARPGYSWVVPRAIVDVLHDWAAGKGPWLGVAGDPTGWPKPAQPLVPEQPQTTKPAAPSRFRKV